MSELEKVREAVQTYVNGVVEFNFLKGESPWHPKGLKISYDSEKDSLSQYTIAETRPDLTEDQIEVVKKRISQQGVIESAEVTGNAANVKLIWNFQNGDVKKEITDYILLLKIKDEWKIVAKIFSE